VNILLNGEILSVAIKKFPYFKNLFEDKEKSQDINYHKIKSGTYAFFEGEYYSFISLVLSGTIRVSKISENGRELVLYRVKQGESCILHISSALSKQPYSATAFVEEDIEVINIPVAAYQEEMANVDMARVFTYQLYNKRISNMMVLLEEIVFNKMDKRIAEFLLQKSTEENHIIEITHEEIAIELGSAREVVSRILKEFEKINLIKLSRRKITILNHVKLATYYESL